MRRVVPLLVALVALVAVVGVVAAQLGGSRTATGVVVSVEATGLTSVERFRLRTGDGQVLDFRLGRLENAAEFPPAHLHEHRATAQPVVVWYRDENGSHVAYRIEDAP